MGRDYPPPNHLHPAYKGFGRANGTLLLSKAQSALDVGEIRTKTLAAEHFQC